MSFDYNWLEASLGKMDRMRMKLHFATNRARWLLIISILLFGAWWAMMGAGEALAQQPTVALATVTGTKPGAIVSVRPQEQQQINVRSGPGTMYPKVGVLIIGQQLPAKGRTAGGDWILVEYPGVQGSVAWVYAPLVNLIGGDLPIVEPPATPTPLYTPTIDPTLAARFVITSVPTRLPTFTQPPPLVMPTFPVETQSNLPGGVPMGLIIFLSVSAGSFIGLFTLARGR